MMQAEFGGRLDYLFELRQGRTFALNAGIAHARGELIGTIDDDEEIDVHWYERVYQAFAENPQLDFIGGACVPRWGAERPEWLPESHGSVIGWVDGGNRVVPYDENYPGILMGGNAVLKRTVFERVGVYSTELGRTAKGLLSCDDEDMYRRLLAAKTFGLYLPDLIIHHYVPPERLTKSYYRRWCYWNGVSRGWLGRGQREPVTYLGGVPRYLYGNAVRGIAEIAAGVFRPVARQPKRRFTNQLAVCDLIGFIYGTHFYRPATESSSESKQKLKEQKAL